MVKLPELHGISKTRILKYYIETNMWSLMIPWTNEDRKLKYIKAWDVEYEKEKENKNKRAVNDVLNIIIVRPIKQ